MEMHLIWEARDLVCFSPLLCDDIPPPYWQSESVTAACVQGITYDEAMDNFWILDAKGLITIKRDTPLSDSVKSFARKTQEDVEGEALVDTVRRVLILFAMLTAACDHPVT